MAGFLSLFHCRSKSAKSNAWTTLREAQRYVQLRALRTFQLLQHCCEASYVQLAIIIGQAEGLIPRLC